jgi:hypothetical protein
LSSDTKRIIAYDLKGIKKELITIAQIRGARGLLSWSQTDLANAAAVSVPSIKRLEGHGLIKASDDLRAAVQHALEKAGIEFIAENGGGVGVRLRKPKQKRG